MSEYRANTDIMRNGVVIISKAASGMSVIASRVNNLASQIGGEYQGQLREKVRPILSGLSGEGSQLQGQSEGLGSGLSSIAGEIDAVMQSNVASVAQAFAPSPTSPTSTFFNNVSQMNLGGWVAAILGVLGIHLQVAKIQSQPPPIPAPATPPSTPTNIDSTSSSANDRAAEGDALVKQYDGTTFSGASYNLNQPPGSLVDPPLTNTEGDRDPNIYLATMNQFAVGDENGNPINPRYEPVYDSKGNISKTYCNIYVLDVTKAMGAEIPYIYDPATGKPLSSASVPGALYMSADRMAVWLQQHGNTYGWKAVTADQAQKYANMGKPAIVISTDPSEGHVAMVRPGENSSQGPTIAQAGKYNYNITHVNITFVDPNNKNKLLPVLYYVHE